MIAVGSWDVVEKSSKVDDGLILVKFKKVNMVYRLNVFSKSSLGRQIQSSTTFFKNSTS